MLCSALHDQWRLAQRRQDSAGDPQQALLRHAIESVPFYGMLFNGSSGSRSSDIHGIDVRDFPLSTKEMILAGHSDRHSRLFDRSGLTNFTTSGTTGIPRTVPRDSASHYFFSYESFHDVSMRVAEFREHLRPGIDGVALINDNPDRAPFTFINPAIGYALNHRYILGIDSVNDERLVLTLREATIPLLYGRPRALLRLAELDASLGKAPRTIRPTAILVSGDNLYPDDRMRLANWFGCSVFNAYISQESGFVGMDCEHSAGMHVFGHRAVVEVLRDNGEVSSDGEGELVVTNLENWAMPFIRYRTGDIARVETGSCACGYVGPTITELAGRDSTHFILNGNRLNPSVLNPIFEALPVRQFQVVQRSERTFDVLWIPARDAGEPEKIEHTMRMERSG